MADDFENLRAGLLVLLDRVEENVADDGVRDAICVAALRRITDRHELSTWRTLRGPASDYASRIARMLADADEEFPERVPEFETLVKERLELYR